MTCKKVFSVPVIRLKTWKGLMRPKKSCYSKKSSKLIFFVTFCKKVIDFVTFSASPAFTNCFSCNKTCNFSCKQAWTHLCNCKFLAISTLYTFLTLFHALFTLFNPLSQHISLFRFNTLKNLLFLKHQAKNVAPQPSNFSLIKQASLLF